MVTKLYLDKDGTVSTEEIEDTNVSLQIYAVIQVPRKGFLKKDSDLEWSMEKVFETGSPNQIKKIISTMNRVLTLQNHTFKLKPCPRCGGEAIMHRWNPRGDRKVYVYCSECHMRTMDFLLETHARDDWNYRNREDGVKTFKIDEKTRIDDDEGM